MLHKFFEEGDWFAPKKIGYGAGLPIAWQGWALLASYIALMAGFGVGVGSTDFTARVLAICGMVGATGLFVMIAKARTRGGWKWRK